MDNVDINFDLIILNIRKGKYRCIGSGSGRRVFDLENGYVIKVAKNRKGIAQNEAEYQIAMTNHSNIFAKITHVSEDFMLLIMEKAERLYHFSYVLKYFNVRSNRELFQIEEFRTILKKHNLLSVDLCKRVNWGVINNCPVIIDYGFTWRVKRKYYFPF